MTGRRVLRVLFVCFVIMLLSSGTAHAAIFSDDFSVRNTYWRFGGSAPPGMGGWPFLTDGHLLLTPAQVNSQLQAWFTPGEPNPFVARFNFKAGGGTGGDGIVFMFYKNTEYMPNPGGGLGFQPYNAPAAGYGIEFDSFVGPEGGDPLPHVALIKDSVATHLASKADARVADNQWHEAVVTAGVSSVTVDIDGERVIDWSGPIDRTYQGFGFSAATGALTNEHWIDNLHLESPTAIYRFYNVRTGVHFYTASWAEKSNVQAKYAGLFQLEGVSYYVDTKKPTNNVPLHRFYNMKAGVHFYTASEAEKQNVIAKYSGTYKYEGVAYYVSLAPSGMPVYRFYNRNAGVHFYTASAVERDDVIRKYSSIYTLEGVGYYIGQ